MGARRLWESEAFNPTLLDTCDISVAVFERRTCPHRPVEHWSDPMTGRHKPSGTHISRRRPHLEAENTLLSKIGSG